MLKGVELEGWSRSPLVSARVEWRDRDRCGFCQRRCPGSIWAEDEAAWFPTLSFKDRVMAVVLAQASAFGLEVVGCSSTGNLGNAVAAQAERLGLEAWVFIPADLEAAKVLGTAVYGRG